MLVGLTFIAMLFMECKLFVQMSITGFLSYILRLYFSMFVCVAPLRDPVHVPIITPLCYVFKSHLLTWILGTMILCLMKLVMKFRRFCFKAITARIRKVWICQPQLISWPKKWRKHWKSTSPFFQLHHAPQVHLSHLPPDLTTQWHKTVRLLQTMIESLKGLNWVFFLCLHRLPPSSFDHPSSPSSFPTPRQTYLSSIYSLASIFYHFF